MTGFVKKPAQGAAPAVDKPVDKPDQEPAPNSATAALLKPLRERIDALDRQVLELLAQRMAVVTEVAAAKRSGGARIRDYEREREVLDDRCALARTLGLPEGPVESIYRQIMLAARDYQASLGVGSPVRMVPRKVAVIGGAGQMGALLARVFRELGHEVSIADVSTELTPEQAAQSAEVVVISVPIQSTVALIERIGPLVREDALLLDVTSIKQAPVAAMLRCSRASVVGTHPMFGPGVHSLQGQRVVVCPGRGEVWQSWLEQLLEARGLVVTRASAEEHDRAMALVQVLTHFQTQVLGWTLARTGMPLQQSLRFTSPAYLMELYVCGRHFAQDPQLYGPIEMLNPDTALVTAAFQDAASELRRILEARDQAAFDRVFEEVRAFFGSFALEATEQSSFMIDRLIERSLG
ncbi:MAG TPA: bifunctional chorismate mutase/prephenate dehydrogenase [Polyangiales bacterium]|nr:bifunctional chorismate mutase/prephenate dehydrogenase [Polyangiales bacterium]